jgi:hypothetical protein
LGQNPDADRLNPGRETIAPIAFPLFGKLNAISPQKNARIVKVVHNETRQSIGKVGKNGLLRFLKPNVNSLDLIRAARRKGMSFRASVLKNNISVPRDGNSC